MVKPTAFILLVALGGCVAEDATPAPRAMPDNAEVAVDVSAIDTIGDVDRPELCVLAAALPDDDLCSLICDPAALAAQMVADGMERGFCYQLRCTLDAEITVSVGVCLAP
ncbi:MAG: hypothetical protein AB7O24_18375 [Kofleriaceae bacterium]